MEAAALLKALAADKRAKQDVALWATLFYGGLRLGEAQALRWRSVKGVLSNESNQPLQIDVVASWDNGPAGELEPKSRAGRRSVPCPEILGPTSRGTGSRQAGAETISCSASRARCHLSGDDPRRGDRVWRKAGLEPIDPHECRHSYVSLMHAAGIPLERIGDYVGHTRTFMTSRYRHLVAGQAEEDAARLNAYLAPAVDA